MNIDTSSPTRGSPEDEIQFRSHLQHVNVSGLRTAGVLIAVLAPLFSVLDRYVIPQHFLVLLMLRILLSVSALAAVGLTYQPFGRRWVGPLSIGVFLLAGATISVMIHLHLGYRDPYYAGLMLVILGAGVLMKWRLQECYVAYGGIYVGYIGPCLAQPIDDVAALVGNNLFLVSTIVIVTAGQYTSVRLLRREFMSGRALQVALNRLQELDKLKTEFFSNITHELRTPLTTILSPLESLLEG